jgi:hypothetical protein
VSGCAPYSRRPGTGGFWAPGAAQGRGPDLREDQSLRPCGTVWCILADWLVTQIENAGRKRLDATVISRLEKRAGKKIEPFRKFQYSDTFFKPGLDILTGIGFGAISRTKYRSHKKIRVEGETGVDTRDISYAI